MKLAWNRGRAPAPHELLAAGVTLLVVAALPAAWLVALGSLP